MLVAHPRVSGVPSETHLISHGIEPLLERFQHTERDSQQVGAVYVERDAIIDAARDLCDTAYAGFLEPGTTHLVERTPLHVLHLPLLAEIYPDAKVLHVIRDGRDVARSIAWRDWGPDSIAGAAREWRQCVEAGRAGGL